MNISVRVLSANAQAQIKALQAQVRALEGQLARANATSAAPNAFGNARSRKSLVAYGSQLQWTGRQLQYNWTIPILLAGAAATKFALDNEKAFTRVKKVYGDVAGAQEFFMKNGMTKDDARIAATRVFANELGALEKAFVALSNQYGVNQKEVLETASAWAAAGASGVDLAKATEMSIKASILGDMSLAQATKSLISIQAQYTLSSQELGLTLAELNAIENQTAISMSDLIEGFTRSAGQARETGVDVRHLGAMLAALVPASGSASSAGNGLKTIMSRLLSPTEEATKVMAEFGVVTTDAAWKSSTATERLTILAKHMGDGLKQTGKETASTADDMYKLSDSQKQVVAATLGSRYQVNRFLILMREMDSDSGNYQKALDATSDRTNVFNQATKELNAVLESNPQKLKIMWSTMQNGMATAIQPMIPYLIYLAKTVASIAVAFGNLDPALQKFIMFGLFALAMIGPLVKYMGSLMTLVGVLAIPFKAASTWMLAFAVTEKIVDGETVRTRLSILGLIRTMIAWPFVKIANGLWLIVTALGGLVAASKALWIKIVTIWTLSSLSLPKILLRARYGLQAVWASIVAVQRSGALAAAAATIGPWVALAALIGTALYMLRKQIVQIWNNIIAYFSDSTNAMTTMVVKAWNALPQGIANALVAVARIVRDAALAIYEWFSYINPFARHSPSLVENVTEGMKVVGDQFGKAKNTIGAHVRGAYSDIKAFGAAVKGILKGAASFEEAAQRAKIKKFAPAALNEFDALARRLVQLSGDLDKIKPKLDAQQAVVDRWTAKLEAANKVLDVQQKKLDGLTKTQDAWSNSLDEAKNRLSNFANAPIEGMKAMSDAIFENDMAHKQLRLDMMRMEDVTGTYDDIQSKIDAIAGSVELLRGEQASLRAAGAGSDILSGYDDQIAALQATSDEQVAAAQTLSDMSKQLDILARKGEELDLVNSLEFDPLTRQIEAAANAMQELPFAAIMAGVQGASADIAYYQQKLDAATAAVNAQQAVVDSLTAARDLLAERLDTEKDKLDVIKESYDKVAQAISDVKDAMNDASGAADTLASKAKKGADYTSPAVANFRGAAGGNFADVSGQGSPIRTDYTDQTKLIEQFTKDASDKAASAFGSLNPFAPFKKKWNEFVAWIGPKWDEFSGALGDMFSNIFDGVVSSEGIGKTVDRFKVAWATVVDWFRSNIIGPLVKVWDLLGPSVTEILVNAWGGIKDVFNQVAPALEGLVQEVMKMGPAFQGFWNIAGPVIAYFVARVLLIGKVILNIVAKTIQPALAMVGGIIGNIIQVIKGAIQIVSGFFMLFAPGHFTEGLKKMAAGVLNIFGGLFGQIGAVIKGAFKIIVGFFWGIIDGIIDAAKWLYDVLVGHSIIPDLVNAIIAIFKTLVTIVQWLWNNVVLPIIAVFKKLFDMVLGALRLWWAGIQVAFAVLKTLATWMWDNILKPVIDIFVGVWSNWIQPALALWWEGFKLALAAFLTAATWLWDNVLKPIFDTFKSVWDNWIKPAIALWWEGFKTTLSGFLTAGKWFWDNVLKPVFNKVKEIWDNWIKPGFAQWWENLKRIWSGLTTAGKWVWDNVLSPIFTKVKDIWISVKGSFEGWWEGIKKAFSSLVGLGKWFYDNVMKPVFDKVKEVWGDIKDWLSNNKDMLMKPMKAIVGVLVGAVNTIINGLNGVAKLLPGLDWHIDTIPGFDQGGAIPNRRVGSGFKTNGARAIVGEGKANYPEFVIPTDPTHRRRAAGLLITAANRMGMIPGGDSSSASKLSSTNGAMTNTLLNGVPAYGIGGILDDAWGGVKNIGDKLKDELKKLGKNAIGKAMNPLLNASENIVNKVGWTPPKAPPLFGIKKVRDWVKGNDEDLAKYVDKAQEMGRYDDALKWARTQNSASYKMGAMGPDAYDCSGFMSAITNHINGKPIHTRVGTTASFPWNGFSYGGNGKNFTIGSIGNYGGSGVGHMAGTLAGVNVESRGGAGVLVGAAARGYNDSGFNKVYSMYKGGVAKARRGGVLANIAEGGYDEVVTPLPHGYDPKDLVGGGGKHYHFYGDLSFPNITDADDAEEFLKNLETITKD